MFIRDVGRGPVVLLLHGTPSPSSDWFPLADALASRYRVLIPDLPGYGSSPSLPSPTMERVGDTIVDMLRQHDAASPHAIVGYSTGAYRAFDLVTRCGIAPSVLVSLAGVVNFDMASRDARRYFARRFAEDPGFGTSAEARAAMLDLMVSAGWLADHPQDAARIVGWLSTTTPQALSAELNALATSRDLRPELQRVRARVYARVGSLDRGCPPGWSDEIARLVPRATIDIVLGCGHALLLEDGPGTVEAIKREIDAGASG